MPDVREYILDVYGSALRSATELLNSSAISSSTVNPSRTRDLLEMQSVLLEMLADNSFEILQDKVNTAIDQAYQQGLDHGSARVSAINVVPTIKAVKTTRNLMILTRQDLANWVDEHGVNDLGRDTLLACVHDSLKEIVDAHRANELHKETLPEV